MTRINNPRLIREMALAAQTVLPEQKLEDLEEAVQQALIARAAYWLAVSSPSRPEDRVIRE